MEKICFTTQKGGFYGICYPCALSEKCAVILMMGNTCDGLMAKAGVRWLHSQNCSVMVLSPDPESDGFHSYPLENIQKAIAELKRRNVEKIGFVGISVTAMIGLAAAACCPEITFTLALTPCDFVVEGYRKRKGKETPADGESILTCGGKPLQFLPYAWRGETYWKNMKTEAKNHRNMVESRKLFELSEQMHPVTEQECIPVENIHGTVVFAGAEDDCMWDTCRYIRRMQSRLREKGGTADAHFLLYSHGTHFVFPQSMLEKMLPVGSGIIPWAAFCEARKFPIECRKTRTDIDEKVRTAILRWKNS